MEAHSSTTRRTGVLDLVPSQAVKAPRLVQLAAHLAGRGFDLHHTSWGIYIVASGMQSGWLAAACRLASFASEVTR